MSKGDAFEQALLDLIFLNTAIANIGDAAGLQNSAAAGSLFVALHTADPGEAGNQSTSEIAYTGYARVAVARSGAGWSRSGNTITPVANIGFGAMTAGAGGTVTNFSVGTLSSGAGMILYKGAVTPNIVVTNGVTPLLTTATNITED